MSLTLNTAYAQDNVSQPDSPVSLQQTRTLPRNDMATMLEKKRKVNALIADHEQQVMLKQAEEQSEEAKRNSGSEDSPQ